MLEVVIVDDTQEDLILAERVFRDQCKLVNPITLCSNGQAAISLIEKRQQEDAPFLMFLDLRMEPTSGLDVLRHWQKSQCVGNSVIVMLSGLTDMKAIHSGYQHGAKTFVLKPLNQGDLLQVLNGLSDRVAIQDVPEGYALHWRCDGETPPGISLSKRGVVTLSA